LVGWTTAESMKLLSASKTTAPLSGQRHRRRACSHRSSRPSDVTRKRSQRSQKGSVTGIREGVNPQYGEFDVLTVEMEDKVSKLFAANLSDHVLNEDPSEDPLEHQLDPLEIQENYGAEIESRLEAERRMRTRLEQELQAKDDELRAEEDDFLEKTAADMLGEPAAVVDAQEVVLEAGATYLLGEGKPEASVDLFIREMDGGARGLYITRSNPKHVRSEHNLGDASIWWLTRVKASDGTPSVSGLHELSIIVSDFIEENKDGVILLDGVEYLVSNNDFSMVLRLIQQMRDKVSTSEARMLIPVNQDALDSKQMTLLERECRSLD